MYKGSSPLRPHSSLHTWEGNNREELYSTAAGERRKTLQVHRVSRGRAEPPQAAASLNLLRPAPPTSRLGGGEPHSYHLPKPFIAAPSPGLVLFFLFCLKTRLWSFFLGSAPTDQRPLALMTCPIRPAWLTHRCSGGLRDRGQWGQPTPTSPTRGESMDNGKKTILKFIWKNRQKARIWKKIQKKGKK